MTNEERNTALYKKMFVEQENYRKWLLKQPPEEILKHTYEYTAREDILLSLEYHDLTDAQADALLNRSSPLGDVFEKFERRGTDYIDEVFDSVVFCADAVIRTKTGRQMRKESREEESNPRCSIRTSLQKISEQLNRDTVKKKNPGREVR